MDSNKEKILELLEVALKKFPELRVCQLISNVLKDYDDQFYITDEFLIDKLKEFLKNN